MAATAAATTAGVARAWAGFGATTLLPWAGLDTAYAALAASWGPLFTDAGGRWDPNRWRWS
jgi:hypothetical protein